MANDIGRAGGITGLLDIPGFSASIPIELRRWNSKVDGGVKILHGRGDTVAWRGIRWTYSEGSIGFRGRVSLNAAPAPALWKDLRGTITENYGTGSNGTARTIVWPVMIQSIETIKDDKTAEIADVAGSLVKTGEATYAGWTAAGANAPSKADQQQWAGTTFTYDENDLLTAANIVWDIWGGTGNDDDSEWAKLLDIVTSQSGVYAGLKNYRSTWTRDAIDGGSITIEQKRTNSAEDVTNPPTARRVDPNKMTTGGITTAINNDSPTIPTVSGQTLVERTTTRKPLNDANDLFEREYGQRSTIDDVEMEETNAKIDLLGIESSGQDTTVYASGAAEPANAAAPDASLKAVAKLIQDINLDRKKKVTYFDVNSSYEKILFARNKVSTDPSALKSVTIKGAIFTTGSEPPPPGASGLVLRNKEVVTIVSPDTTNLSAVFWLYAETTEGNDVTYGHSRAIADPLEIYQREVSTLVTSATDINTLADAALATNKADKTFVNAELRRITPATAEQILRFTAEDQKRHSYAVHTFMDNFRGKPAAGWDDPSSYGDPAAYVKVIVPGPFVGGPGGFTRGEITPVFWRRKITYFKVRRRFITTTSRQPQDFYFQDRIGTVNSSAFLEFPAHWCMYEGPEPIYNGTYNDNHLVVVDLTFKADSLMHMQDGDLPAPGEHYVYNSGSLLAASGYYDADSTFSDSSGVYAVGWPSAADFSTFGVL